MIKPLYKKIGNGKPSIAIVGCLHGDEIIGKKVINTLKNVSLIKGSITFIYAHPEAVKKKKRYIRKDLNRSFPGKETGVLEEKIAALLLLELKKHDLVIDIHATNSDFKELVIVTKYNKKERELLKIIPISKIALIHKSVFGGNEMITHCKLGISLEYGPNKTGLNAPVATRQVRTILCNLGMLKGKKRVFSLKELYTVTGSYSVPDIFSPNQALKNFKIIKQGSLIGTSKRQKLYADKSFYPLFLGKGRYKKTLALISKKKEVSLKI